MGPSSQAPESTSDGETAGSPPTPDGDRAGSGLHPVSRAVGPLLLAITIVVLGFSSGGFAARTQSIAAVVYAGLTIAVAAFVPGSVERLRGPLLLAAAAIWAFAGWTLLSGSWSGSQSRALLEFARAFLYATTLVLFGLLAPRRRAIPDLLAAIALAGLGLCVAGLMTRLLPDVFSFGADQRTYGRLEYPVRYPSTLGLIAAVGAVLSISFSADSGRSAVVKVLGSAATPVFAVTLLLSYSRGPIAGGAVALAVFLAAGFSAAMPGTLLAIAVPTAAATYVAFQADRLAIDDFTSARAISQGHRTAVALGVCVLLAGVLRAATTRLDRRFARARRRPRRRPGPGQVAAGAIAAGLLLGGLVVATNLSGLEHGYARFSQPGTSQPDTRGRLTDVQGGDRLQAWRVALADFRSAPVHGRGAGTFVLSWDQRRPYEIPFNETHSLYLQMLGELGLVGAALLLLVLGLIVVGIGICARGRHRVSAAAALAVTVGWLVAVSVDWHWQMPVVTVWVFALGGAALAVRRVPRRLGWPLGRWVGVVALAAATIVPGRVAIAESQLGRSLAAFRTHDCPATEVSARAAHSALGELASPLMLLGYCAAIAGNPTLAVRAEEQAVSRDPNDWTLRYALATVRAAEGLDPRPAARAAQQLNPLEPLVGTMVRTLRGSDPRAWRRQVAAVPIVLPSDFDA